MAGSSPSQSRQRAGQGFVPPHASTTHPSPTCSQYVPSITSLVQPGQACPGTKQPQSPSVFAPSNASVPFLSQLQPALSRKASACPPPSPLQECCCPLLQARGKAPHCGISPTKISTSQEVSHRQAAKQQPCCSPLLPSSPWISPDPRVVLACCSRGAFAAVALAVTFIPTPFPGELVNRMFVSHWRPCLSS